MPFRVLQRVFCVKSLKKRPHTDRSLWAFAEAIVPKDIEEARSFNYGVLDFARKICTSRNPRCYECPLKNMCAYYLKTEMC